MDPVRDSRQRSGPALIARLRRWFKPPRILRPTRAGWLFFVITFGVGFAALNTGNNLLYLVLSLMLAFLALSGVLSETALRGIQVRRRVPRELYARGQNAVQLEITNDQRRVPAFAIVVEDRLQPAPDGRLLIRGIDSEDTAPRSARRRAARAEIAGRCFALRVGAGETEKRRYAIEPDRRGEMTYASFAVSTRFPFGLFSKSREIDAVERVLVFPEITAVPHGTPPTSGEGSGRAVLSRTGAGSTVIGLREFRDGDSQRHVHWPASLRRSTLLVCETEDERNVDVEVRLRGVKGDGEAAVERFESGVSRTASEIVRYLRSGLAVGLRTDATVLPADAGPRQHARLLAFLARVGRDGRAVGEAPQ